MLGIDISDRSVKIAEVSGGTLDSKQLNTVCWSATPPGLIRRGVVQDVRAVTDLIRDALTKCSPVPVKDKMLVASIPESQSFVRVLDIPTMADKEMDEAVQWAVKQHIPFDLERVYLDWQPLPKTAADGRRQVLVGAAQRDVVDPLLQVFDALELKVLAFELEAQAIVRSLLPIGSSDVQGVLILDIGATSTNIIYFDGGVMRFTASVQSGGDDLTRKLSATLNLDPQIAAEKKAIVGASAQGNEPAIASSLHDSTLDLMQQVGKTVSEMTAQIGGDHPVRAILLSGGTANLPGIIGVVSEVFPNIPVQMGNPWTNIFVEGGRDKAPLSTTDASHFVTAVGLALRSDVAL